MILPATLIDAGTGEDRLVGVSIAFGGGEGELFYALALDGGNELLMLHLTPGGGPSGQVIGIAVAAAQSSNAVSVASDGTEIASCWEDVGPWFSRDGYCDGDTGAADRVQFHAGGWPGATDQAMDGGVIECGHVPVLSAGATTLLAFFYVAELDFDLLYPLAARGGEVWGGLGGGFYAKSVVALASTGGYTLLQSGPLGVGYTSLLASPSQITTERGLIDAGDGYVGDPYVTSHSEPLRHRGPCRCTARRRWGSADRYPDRRAVDRFELIRP